MTGADPLQGILDRQGFVVLDGGLATALESAGHSLATDLWSARVLIDDPGAVRSVHRAYLDAGADCITTAGYQASFEGFAAAGLTHGESVRLMRTAVRIAVEERDAFWADQANRSGRERPLVAASAGPYGAFLADGSEYTGRYGVGTEVLDRFHRERFDVLAATEADLVAFETIPSVREAEVIVRIVGEARSAWAWVSFTCRDGGRLRDGTAIERAVDACTGCGYIAAIGANCLEPRHAEEAVGRMRSVTDLPIVLYPNSGERYDVALGAWQGEPSWDDWLGSVPSWVAAGADAVGGCCRVGPDVIARVRRSLLATSGSRAGGVE